MLGKRSRPVTGKLPDPAICFLETLTSPKSPLDIKIRSPRGLKTCNLGGGVGLGIVAALDKSRGSGSGSGSGGEAPAPVNIIVFNLNLIRSDPIPIELSADKSKTTTTTNKCCRDGGEMMGCNWDEFTTCVTSHGPSNKSFTRLLYFDGGEDDGLVVKHKPDFGAVYPSPLPQKPVIQPFPTSNFLSSCYLCQKHLHGKDIYMYRGEKAFCSAECRYRQIVSDERKEKCWSEASRSVDISVSPYSGGHLFSTGVFAA